MSRKRKIWLGLFAVLIAGFAALIALSGYLIKPALEYVLRDNGFPMANIENVRVIPYGLLLENVALDGEEFSTIGAAQIKGSWPDIVFNRHVNSIELKNVELSGEIDERGQYIIAGWNASLAAEGQGDKPSLAIDNIEVNGLTLDFETPEGAIRIEGKLALQSKPDQSRDFQANLWGKQKQLSFNATATGAVKPDGDWLADIELLEGRIDLGAVKATRASGKVRLASVPAGITYIGTMAAGGVRFNDIPFQDFEVKFDSHKSEILQFRTSPTGHDGIVLGGRLLNQSPLLTEASISVSRIEDVASLLELDQKDFAAFAKAAPLELKISAPFKSLSMPQISTIWSLAMGQERQILIGTAVYDRDAGKISGTLQETSVPLTTLAQFLPAGERIKLKSGTVSLSAQFSTETGAEDPTISGTAKLQLKNIGGSWGEYPFTGISGTVALAQLYPWVIEKNQSVSVAVIGTGVNLTAGKVTFDGQQDGSLNVKEARFSIAGGTVSAQPFKWNFNSRTNNMTFKLDKLDLNNLAASVAADGFKAAGTISGTVPLSFTPKGIVFKDAQIRGDGPGAFNYQPSTYPAALQGDDARMTTVRTALSDYRYSSLEISVAGSLDGDLKTTLKATGKNPVFEDRDINFNINLEGALAPALQEALQPGSIADRIEKSLSGGRP